MKKTQIKFLKGYNILIGGLLTLLGFSACDTINPDPKDEYGCPSADFIVNGKIESENDNVVIENIQVGMYGDTVYSDKNGEYQVESKNYSTNGEKFNISFKDVDGTTNGDYKNLDTIVDFTDIEFTDGDGIWYMGKKTKELNIKLAPKK